MKNSEYWKRRFEQLEDEQYRKTERYYKDIENQFRMAQNHIRIFKFRTRVPNPYGIQGQLYYFFNLG